MGRRVDVRAAGEPLRVWLVILALMFLTEVGIMLVLPIVLPGHSHPLLEATVDSVLLTTVVAPLLWRLLVHPLRAAERTRAAFLAELFTSIEADRRQTALELHDGIGQSLSLLVSGLRTSISLETDPDVVRRHTELKHLAKQTLAEVKRLALGLRPSLLDDLGLEPALERLMADMREHTPVAIAFDATAVGEQRFHTAVETALFRIAQEALSNVAEHSRARSATVTMRMPDNSVELEVEDDGVGIASEILERGKPGHMGLTGMRERATLLGGSLTVDSTPGRGTRITARIPRTPPEASA
ncbi:MAG: sensor histidine kinase [Gemmataceae bacterium]